MPQVDLETLARCNSGDNKVSCETLISTLALSDPDPDPDPNVPPESIRIPIHQHSLDYIDISYDRDDSAKESTNPKSQSHANPNPNPNPSFSTRSGSQRYAKANGPILGLPNKIKHVTCTVSRHGRPQTSSRIFPKKKNGKKSAVPEFEPGSPKVSCFGKVLSDREQEKCRPGHVRQREVTCWEAIFSCGRRQRAADEAEERDDVARRNIPFRKRNIPSEESPASAQGIGGMMRFSSGRRAASWGGDEEVEAGGQVTVDLGRRSWDGRVAGPAAV